MVSLNEHPLGNAGTGEYSSAAPLATQWSSTLQSVLDQPTPSFPLKLIVGGVVFAGAFATWAWFGQIDEIARAPGKLIPKTGTRKVQPMESGKVATLKVKEGDTVRAGQVLMELDTELAQKEIERLQTLLSSAQTELRQTQEILERTHMQASVKASIAKIEIDSQRVAIEQNQAMVMNQRQLLRQLQEDAQKQQERLSKFQLLTAEGAISQEQTFSVEQTVRDRQRTITESTGILQRSLSELKRLQVGLAQRQAEAQQSYLEASQQIQQLQLRQTELAMKINETAVLLAAAQAKLQQRFVYATHSGTILTLYTRQTGEFVQPGQAIAEIAPAGEPLILSTLLPSHEAGFVKPGMVVKVKLDAFPYQEFGIVPGKVLSVSLDSKTTEQGNQVYRVDVELDRHAVNGRGQKVSFKSGQTATAEIVTRHRRMADVLLDPIKQLQGNANL